MLIPRTISDFICYVLDTDEDIEEFLAALGLDMTERYATFVGGRPVVETEDDCIDRHLTGFAADVNDFPTGQSLTDKTREALLDCIEGFASLDADSRLLRGLDTEYKLYRLIERTLCAPEICRLFRDVDDFVKTASSILNRRKSKAGRSLENHMEQVLRDAGIPYASRSNIAGKPDLIIPSVDAYHDQAWPEERLFAVGLKRTCKDRWRQVLNEAPRVRRKHLITLQRGISTAQMQEMADAGLSLVVPKDYHSDFPKNRPLKLMTIEDFVSAVKTSLAS